MLYVLGGGVAAWGVLLLVNSALRGASALRHADSRHRQHAAAHARAGARAVLFLAGAVRDVDPDHAGGDAVHFGATDTAGAAYNEGANWVGVLFARLQRLRGAGGHGHSAAWCVASECA